MKISTSNRSASVALIAGMVAVGCGKKADSVAVRPRQPAPPAATVQQSTLAANPSFRPTPGSAPGVAPSVAAAANGPPPAKKNGAMSTRVQPMVKTFTAAELDPQRLDDALAAAAAKDAAAKGK